MSNLFKKLQYAAGTIKNVAIGIATGKDMLVSDETANKRLEICKECKYFIKETKRCNECGCFAKIKTMEEALKLLRNAYPDKDQTSIVLSLSE